VTLAISTSILDASSITLSIDGSLVRFISSIVAVSASALEAGVLTALSEATAMIKIETESAAASVTSNAAVAAAAIGAELSRATLYTGTTSTILDEKGLTACASAVRSSNVTVIPGLFSSDVALVSAPMVGAMMAVSTAINAGQNGTANYFYFASALLASTITVAGFIYRRWKRKVESKRDATPLQRLTSRDRQKHAEKSRNKVQVNPLRRRETGKSGDPRQAAFPSGTIPIVVVEGSETAPAVTGSELVPCVNQLPPGWSSKTSSDGKTFFVNKALRLKKWTALVPNVPVPVEGSGEIRSVSANPLGLPPGWSSKTSSNGITFFLNKALRLKQWTAPEWPREASTPGVIPTIGTPRDNHAATLQLPNAEAMTPEGTLPLMPRSVTPPLSREKTPEKPQPPRYAAPAYSTVSFTETARKA
jgi:hypothetical protein